jgi:hypothetical protein
VGGQKIYKIKGFDVAKKVKTKKNSKIGDFLILTLIHEFINFLKKNW